MVFLYILLNVKVVVLIIKFFVTISQCITKNKLLILQKNIMKKVFFSAVALVAFSFAGMANEIEEKKVEIKVSMDNNLYSKSICEMMAEKIYRETVWDTGSQIYAEYRYSQTLDACLSIVKGLF